MTIHYQRANANASLISMVQRFSDIVLIFASLYAICLLNNVDFEIRYLLFSLIVLVIFQMVGGITDFYRSWRGVKISAELKLILKNWFLSYVLALGIISLFHDFDLNIRVAAIWFIVVTIGFVLCRSLIRVGAGILRRLGYNTRRVAVVGSLPAGINLLKSFAEEPWMGFIVLGYYNSEPLTSVSDINFCGNFDKLIIDARDGKIDRIYIAMNMQEEAKIKKIVQQLTDTTCSVLLIPDIFTFNILQARTEEINGVPVVPLFDTPLSGINMIFKRLEDIIVSTVILLLISPVLLIISVAVKFSSPDQFFSDNYDMEWMVSLSAFGSFVPCALWKTTKMSSKLQKMIFVLLRSVNFYAALLSMNYLSSLTFGVGKCQLLGPDHMLLPIMNNTVH